MSHHSSGNAVDIAKVNGIPIIGHQGAGSVTEITIQRLLTLQGLMKPSQIISLMTFEDTDNTYAMGDHDDHIHVGFQPLYGTNSKAAKQVNAILKPDQWIKLIDRLGEIDNPDGGRGAVEVRDQVHEEGRQPRAPRRLTSEVCEPPAERLYRFVQLEFPWALGPEDGRYLLRAHAGEEPHHVLVLRTLDPPLEPRGRGRRGRRAPVAEPEPSVARPGVCRATVVDVAVVDDEAARAWLERAAGDGAAETLDEALQSVNDALRAHRAAAADPYVREVLAGHALVRRAGYGVGFEVADGRWTMARELPSASRSEGSRRARRLAALRPQERLAALLSGRDAVLACEELALRARLDLDWGRAREAAMQAHLAMEAAVVELQAFRGQRDVADRLAELDGYRDALAAAANEALQGGPSPATITAVGEALERLEAALRARAAGAQY